MNSAVCWMCERPYEYPDPKYQDVNCPHCKVLCSHYNPADFEPLPPEGESIVDFINQEQEEKMLNYKDEKYQGKFVYLPIMGEAAEFDIVEINEVKGDNPKFNFSESVPVMVNGEQVIDDEGEPAFKKKDLGYHIEAKLSNGKILSVTSISAFIQVFKKHEINDGDKIRVEHIAKGEWKVTKL